jgi:hypothetical protein
MCNANRRHGNDNPLDQFNAVILVQDAQLAQLSVFVNGKAVQLLHRQTGRALQSAARRREKYGRIHCRLEGILGFHLAR